MSAIRQVRFRAVLLAVVSVAAASLVAGCGKGGGGQTFNVSVDGTNKDANESFLNYFPAEVQVHPGDSVVFTWNGPGEPHTVTLGSLVNSVAAEFETLTPAQLQGQPPASLIALDSKVPQLFPQGPGDAVQIGSNACFVATGAPATTGACPQGDTKQPEFDGSQAYYNSGWVDAAEKFTVKVSKATAPGTYRYMCLLHREGMIGKLTVVDKATKVPSPSDQTATGDKEKAAIEAKLAPALKLLRVGKPPLPFPIPGDNAVLAGSGSPDSSVTGSISEFGPKEIKVPVGGSVTWWLIGPHSITFNSTKANDDIRTTASDGSIHINKAAIAPANSPGEPSKPLSGGSPTNPKFAVVASKSWDGQGFLNSGVFSNSFGPPVIEGYKLTFTQAGTYKYLCTVHDDMKGTVVVGGG